MQSYFVDRVFFVFFFWCVCACSVQHSTCSSLEKREKKLNPISAMIQVEIICQESERAFIFFSSVILSFRPVLKHPVQQVHLGKRVFIQRCTLFSRTIHDLSFSFFFSFFFGVYVRNYIYLLRSHLNDVRKNTPCLHPNSQRNEKKKPRERKIKQRISSFCTFAEQAWSDEKKVSVLLYVLYSRASKRKPNI